MLTNAIDDGAAIQDALQEITNQRSVPNIFIGQKHIGGNSDLQAKKAQLPNLLKEAGAL
jgi:glutaredoxin 3